MMKSESNKKRMMRSMLRRTFVFSRFLNIGGGYVKEGLRFYLLP
ncbi:hypothetical protein SB48_HM08orf04187 [Heyndrickxia coagulans]|uniref:Uncharacterized protein n=1 Tax=Heyndrickxia coagulans TaxID=1398 RepID=A0AAN0T772_HEYCO|nr:hypothetical protein SB48_HM08orf04187 [Heyndrickxia coagulans]